MTSPFPPGEFFKLLVDPTADAELCAAGVKKMLPGTNPLMARLLI
jgi:hypothetical protein